MSRREAYAPRGETRRANLSPAAAFVKRSLAAHSWLGLAIGALLYLVCLSGALVVFMQEFERWEQPQVEEGTDVDVAAIERAYHTLAARTEDTHHMFVALPTAEMPRAKISTDHGTWFVGDDGTVGRQVSHEWTDFLVALHLYLHLPTGFGMIVVSALGALLCGLIVSGIAAHPRIFKDAFALRLGGSRHLEQADIHNRLSVWGAPFHLMIGITGAYFGLVGPIATLLAAVYFDGDVSEVTATVHGAEPQVQQPVEPIELRKTLAHMQAIAPEATPVYVTVEDAGTPEQYLIVGATHPGRLIYVEQYRFDATGNYLGNAGYSDGDTGRQAIFSVYRIHFGHFGGFAVKLLYGVLGLALTVVCVTGVNVWLARRRRRDALNNLWTGFVWGTPLAITLAGAAQVVFGLPATTLFWAALLAATAFAQWRDDDSATRHSLHVATGALLAVLLLGYVVRYGSAAFDGAALGVNVVIAAIAAAFITAGVGRRRSAADRVAESAAP